MFFSLLPSSYASSSHCRCRYLPLETSSHPQHWFRERSLNKFWTNFEFNFQSFLEVYQNLTWIYICSTHYSIILYLKVDRHQEEHNTTNFIWTLLKYIHNILKLKDYDTYDQQWKSNKQKRNLKHCKLCYKDEIKTERYTRRWWKIGSHYIK